ncbi:hypothetical protein AB0M48_35085 [Lentzea sp. NPDC051208]|uniref:hypothetical protein n=1 Tax=Lentzea sp. NPDC051208 TaxID=3154642 RepID=UPI003430329C
MSPARASLHLLRVDHWKERHFGAVRFVLQRARKPLHLHLLDFDELTFFGVHVFGVAVVRHGYSLLFGLGLSADSPITANVGSGAEGGYGLPLDLALSSLLGGKSSGISIEEDLAAISVPAGAADGLRA